MHPGAGFGDHALLAKTRCEQRLADAVVDLVRAGVVAVLALQVDLRAAQHLAPAPRVIDRRRSADEVLELVLELGDERGIMLVACVFLAQLVERADQCLGDEHAAIGTEVAGRVRKVVRRGQNERRLHFHEDLLEGLMDRIGGTAGFASKALRHYASACSRRH